MKTIAKDRKVVHILDRISTDRWEVLYDGWNWSMTKEELKTLLTKTPNMEEISNVGYKEN